MAWVRLWPRTVPATIDLQITNNTTVIALAEAVALIHEANPVTVLCIPEIGGLPVGKKPKPKGSKASNQPNQPK